MRRFSFASVRQGVRNNRWWILWFIAIFVVREFMIDWYIVPSGSMYPSIQENHYIVIDRLAYGLHVPFTRTSVIPWATPQRGDTVVLFDPNDGTRLVKRVIGVPGDTLEMHDGHLTRNGETARYTPGPTGWPSEPGLVQTPWVERWSDGSWEPVMRTETPVNWNMHRHMDVTRVPQGMLMVMGDNRDNSADSRVIGMIPLDRVAGKAWLRPLSLR